MEREKDTIDWSLPVELAKQLHDFGSQIEAVCKEQARLFEGLDFTESAKAAIEQLAQKGWTLPMSLTVADVANLADISDEEVDEFFEAVYTENNEPSRAHISVAGQEDYFCVATIRPEQLTRKHPQACGPNLPPVIRGHQVVGIVPPSTM
jgi:hypothetical protein